MERWFVAECELSECGHRSETVVEFCPWCGCEMIREDQ